MKKLNKSLITGLMILSTMTASVELYGKSDTMDYSQNKQPGMESRNGRHQPPPPEQIVEFLFGKYDLDQDGELVGSELSESTLDIVLHRPPHPRQGDMEQSDPETEAEELELILLTDFDLDESGGISGEELVGAMEARKAQRPDKNRR